MSVIAHEPGCGRVWVPEAGRGHRQVFDIQTISVRVTEHQLIARDAAAVAPRPGPRRREGVTAPVQYGPRITAIILYLDVGQFLSKKSTTAALAELFGTPV